jgi:hypothetical protein
MVYEGEQISKKVSVENFSFVILPLIWGGRGEGVGGGGGELEGGRRGRGAYPETVNRITRHFSINLSPGMVFVNSFSAPSVSISGYCFNR